ncbi:MAG: hypothetical protein V8R46_03825 [Eubacterium ramulus]
MPGEIHKSSQRLLTLINDILRLSQLDSVEECVDTEAVDLYEMALNCRDMLADAGEQASCSCACERRYRGDSGKPSYDGRIDIQSV